MELPSAFDGGESLRLTKSFAGKKEAALRKTKGRFFFYMPESEWVWLNKMELVTLFV